MIHQNMIFQIIKCLDFVFILRKQSMVSDQIEEGRKEIVKVIEQVKLPAG